MNYHKLDQLFDKLYPICRSITGPGIRQSLEIIQDYMPLTIEKIATGTQVFDWVVPQEWQLNKASLTTMDGTVILSTEQSNLHVVNFSENFKGRVTKQELEEHLFSIPDFPQAIPYVTSYYKERWGLCIADEHRKMLPDCKYNVDIDTQKYDGYLNYGELFLAGNTPETVLLTSYLCHPSMANNELSGPLALVGLYYALKNLPNRRFSYRFVLLPETIGSISYLATRRKQLEKDIIGGMVLTCLGGPNKQVSFKLSRSDWLGAPTMSDKLARNLADYDADNYRIRDFTPTEGSDERQFCSPAINWPIIQAARTVYANYKEYHTHLDNKDFMQIASVEDSINKLFLFIRIFEIMDLKLKSKIEGGEPQLGRHNLYPTLNGPMSNKMSSDKTVDLRKQLNLLLSTLSVIDGTRTIIDIATKLSAPLSDIMPIIAELKNKNIIE
ncbi:MAG: DUF4910 domain-containing protein [Alphaproteobacteria bacterium]|nr:DUF4910 domain-containing protein [Alphaproteobacteria bacterium]